MSIGRLASVAPLLVWAGAAGAGPAVTLSLHSTRDGDTVVAGTAIDWTIRVSVSTGDNVGLALVCVDLFQNPANPVRLDIPPGDESTIDTTMQNFSRPGGISNPGEGSAGTGYVGVQRGEPGQKNLVQIGGAQNTFGHPGSEVGTSVDVIAGVGQAGEPQLVLAGQFVAPAAAGVYTFELKNPLANVLEAVYAPPALSPVAPAAVVLDPAHFTFTVSSFKLGDLNCDGVINAFDIDPFVLALIDPTGYAVVWPDCDSALADCNGDGKVDAFDIDPFVKLLTGD